MIKIIKKALYTMSSIALIMPAFVAAQYQNPTNPGGVPSAVNANELIMKIVKWALTFLGSLAVLMIVVAGIMYITSGGDEGRVDTAKKWLLYSIVGLVVALLGYAIVNIVGSALN
jgi:hypothetical protein